MKNVEDFRDLIGPFLDGAEGVDCDAALTALYADFARMKLVGADLVRRELQSGCVLE